MQFEWSAQAAFLVDYHTAQTAANPKGGRFGIMTLVLSRLRLKRDASVATLAPILWPQNADARIGVAHRLIWSLFSDNSAAERDFLWREELPGGLPRRGRFYLLSQREPRDALGLFELESKPFEPTLAAGDRLQFVLRANPTVAVKRLAGPNTRGKRLDVVMAALLDLPTGERAGARRAAIQDAGTAWLRRQGARAGFNLIDATVDGYDVRRVERPGKPVQFAALDLNGRLTVNDPSAFLAALARGFGRAKSFGCGLMMIRRWEVAPALRPPAGPPGEAPI